jgi:predicted dithiol-disulfide oxidoreductase (DUF899 family)
MTKRRIGTHEEWRAARDELLAEEKELTHRNDELARKRRQLPWVPDEKGVPLGSLRNRKGRRARMGTRRDA